MRTVNIWVRIEPTRLTLSNYEGGPYVPNLVTNMCPNDTIVWLLNRDFTVNNNDAASTGPEPKILGVACDAISSSSEFPNGSLAACLSGHQNMEAEEGQDFVDCRYQIVVSEGKRVLEHDPKLRVSQPGRMGCR